MITSNRCETNSYESRSGHSALLGVGAWLGAEDRSPVDCGGSRQFVAVGHSEQGHLVEDLAAELHLYSLPFHASTPHVSTEDRFVSVDRISHHAALAVA